jgi:hypothetical protein
MLGDGKWNSGNQGSFFKFNYGVLKLLEDINASIGALPGVDYETRTTTYVATAGGPGYVIGDIIVRYDIIDVATSTLSATIWFNQTTQTTIAAPGAGTITPYNPPSNVTANQGTPAVIANAWPIKITDGVASVAIVGTALKVDGSAVTQPVSIAAPVAVTQSTSPWVVGATNLDIRDLLFATDKVDVSGSTGVGVTGPLTDAQLRATPVPVSGTVTITPSGTQAVSVANGSDVGQGATTDAAVITDTSGTVSGKLRGLVKWAFERMPVALGQTTSAASLPVVIASNQSAVPISGTITAIVNIQSGTATQTTVSVSTASVQVVAANVNRKGLIVTNVGGNAVYISFGTAPTSALFAVSINTTAGAEKYEMLNAVYTGAVNAIRSSGTSNIVVTEFT